MIRQKIVFLGVLFLLVSSAIPEASATVKAGGTCTRTGQTSIHSGVKLACVKSGNKLVWKVTTKFASFNYATQKNLAIGAYFDKYALQASFIDSVPELQSMMNRAIGTYDSNTGQFKNQWDLVHLISNYYSSAWFQNHTNEYILAELIRTTDPCDYIAAYNDARAYIQNVALHVGVYAAGLGVPDTCGGTHLFDKTVSLDEVSNQVSISDWFLHTQLPFWVTYENPAVQVQFASHPWLFLMPKDGFSTTDPNGWTDTTLRSYVSGLILTFDPEMISQEIIVQMDALDKLNHVNYLTGLPN